MSRSFPERFPLRKYWHFEILGEKNRFSWLRLFRRVMRSRSANFLFWFRVADCLVRKDSRTAKSLAKYINNGLIRRHGIEIMLGANIAPGLTLSHLQGIVIFKYVNIGFNFTIRQNTTIGTGFKSELPILIGDNVDIGANSCIVGNGITIGDNVTIGAMSFVNKSISPNSVFYTEKISVCKPK